MVATSTVPCWFWLRRCWWRFCASPPATHAGRGRQRPFLQVTCANVAHPPSQTSPITSRHTACKSISCVWCCTGVFPCALVQRGVAAGHLRKSMLPPDSLGAPHAEIFFLVLLLLMRRVPIRSQPGLAIVLLRNARRVLALRTRTANRESLQAARRVNGWGITPVRQTLAHGQATLIPRREHAPCDPRENRSHRPPCQPPVQAASAAACAHRLCAPRHCPDSWPWASGQAHQ